MIITFFFPNSDLKIYLFEVTFWLQERSAECHIHLSSHRLLFSLAQCCYMNNKPLSKLVLFFMPCQQEFIMSYEHILQLFGLERLSTSFSHSHSLCRNAQMGINGTLRLNTARVKLIHFKYSLHFFH